jgi:hypothetical protein
LGAFWGAFPVAGFPKQPFEVHGVLVDFWPFHSMGFQLVSGSLIPLGVGEGSEELMGELGPGVPVVFECEAVVEPFSHVTTPFLD